VRNLEAALLEHDPLFDQEMTLAAQNQRQTALINAFVRSDQKFDPDDMGQAHQIHLNVERIRVPETWFHPSMAGVDSAGIAEISGWLLNGFSPDERRRMMQVRRNIESIGMESVSNLTRLPAGNLRHWRVFRDSQPTATPRARVDGALALPRTSQDRHRLARDVSDFGLEGNGPVVTDSRGQSCSGHPCGMARDGGRVFEGAPMEQLGG